MPQTTAVCEIVAAIPSSTACVTVPRIATMKAAIIVLEWPGSSPCSAPRRIALGMKSQAWAEPWLRSSAKPGMSPSLQIFGDCLERVDGLALLAVERADGLVEAMVEMILDQRSLGILDRLLHRMKLLGDVEAWPAGLDHGD